MATYTTEQVETILAAYRDLFPSITPALADYWALNRKGSERDAYLADSQDWACLVTNFHRVDPAALQAFQAGYASAIQETRPLGKLGNALKAYALNHGVGYSIGISPWTDHLLLETHVPGARDVVILLGHDWYPIACESYHALPPLTRSSMRDEYAFALRTVPEGITLLFLNLFPHFRAPEAACTGAIASVDYKACRRGFEAVCDALIDSGHRICGILGWGFPVWKALGWGLDRTWRLGINAAWRRVDREGPLWLQWKDQDVPYYPLLHPASRIPHFTSPEHMEAFDKAWHGVIRQSEQSGTSS